MEAPVGKNSGGGIPNGNTDRVSQISLKQDAPSKEDEPTSKKGENTPLALNDRGVSSQSPSSQDQKPQNNQNETPVATRNSLESSRSEASVRDSVKFRSKKRESRTDSRDLDRTNAPPILKNRGNLFFKRRIPFVAWKSYFIVLDEKQFQMSFYKSAEEYEKQVSCRNPIDLRFIEKIVPMKAGLLQSNFPFKLIGRSGIPTVKVASNTVEERARWIDTLQDLIDKIRQSPSSDTQRPAPRGISISSETQTSDSEAVATSALGEDVLIRPRKPSKHGIKLDPDQLTSIKLKKIESEKEEVEEMNKPPERESFDPEQKFGVSLRRISSERRSSSPRTPDSEQVSEFKIKFNSLKRTKAPNIPMSDTLRNTVGDITKKEGLSPSQLQPNRRASEFPRKRSPSPNIPISESVKSVMKKPEESVTNLNADDQAMSERKKSMICHATTTEIQQFDSEPSEIKRKKSELGSPNDVNIQIRNTITKRDEQIDELLSFLDDGKTDYVKTDLTSAISLPLSFQKEEQEEKIISPQKGFIDNTLDEDSEALEMQSDNIEGQVTTNTEAKNEHKQIHRSFSSITITTSARKASEPKAIDLDDKPEGVPKLEAKVTALDSGRELPQQTEDDEKLIEKNDESEPKMTGRYDEIDAKDLIKDQHKVLKSPDERVPRLNEEVSDKKSLPDKEPTVASNFEQEDSKANQTLSTSEVTNAEIKLIEPEDEITGELDLIYQLYELDDIKNTSSDNIRDFMAQMIDQKVTLEETKKSENATESSKEKDIKSSVWTIQYPISESTVDTNETTTTTKDIIRENNPSVKNEKLGKKNLDSNSSPSGSNITINEVIKVENATMTEDNNTIEEKNGIKFDNLKNETQISLEEENECQENKKKDSSNPPERRKSSTTLYPKFNSPDDDQLLGDKHQVSEDEPVSAQSVSYTNSDRAIKIAETDQMQKELSEGTQSINKNNGTGDPLQFAIRMECNLSVEDQKDKRPSTSSLGSSECDEPLPKFCFLGKSDRSSTGSAVLRDIHHAAAEELKYLPLAEDNLGNHQMQHLQASSSSKATKSYIEEPTLVKNDIKNSKGACNKDNIDIKSPDIKVPNESSTDKNFDVPRLIFSEPSSDFVGENTTKSNEGISNAKKKEKLIPHNIGTKLDSEDSDYFPSFSSVEYRTTAEDSLVVQESNESLRTSGINGLKEYLSEEEQNDPETTRGAAISRLGHSVAIEKLRNEAT